MSKTPINNKKLVDSERLTETVTAIKNFIEEKHIGCVHTLANGYDFGLDMSLLFELTMRYEAIENLSYTQWQNDTENYVKYLIYNWDFLCDFVKNVKDNTIITYSFDAFGGDKQLLFIDIDSIEETTDEKTISIISISTYSFNPLTSYITIKNASSVTNNNYRNCLLSFRVASDEPLAASAMYVHTTIAEYDQSIKQYIDDTINGLATRKFGG